MKTKTRVLSWVLAICMIAAIIPAAPAQYANAADGATYVYEFKDPTMSASLPLISGSNITAVNTPLKVADSVKAPYDTYEEVSAVNPTTAKWYLADASLSLSKSDATASNLSFSSGGSFYMAVRASSIAYVDVVIKVENSALYNITSDVLQKSKGTASAASVQFVGKNIAKAAGNTGARETLSLGMHYLDAGEYTVRYTLQGRAGSSGSSNETSFYAYTLTLAEVVPEIVATNAYPIAMNIGDTAKLDVTGVTLGDTNYAATVSAAVTAESVEGVIAVGEDGILTAVKEGSATITTTVAYEGGDPLTMTNEITVRAPAVSGKYVYYMSGQSSDNVASLKNYVGKSFDNLSLKWTLSNFIYSSTGVRDRSLFQNWRGVNITVNGTTENGTADIVIQAPESGWFKLSANLYEENNVDVSYQLKSGSDVLTETNNIPYGNNIIDADNVVYLEKGKDYTFSYTATVTAGQSVTRARNYLREIILTSIPASEIFGDTYAYVRDGSIYFVGGLKAIEGYTEVGFEIWVDGVQADDIKTNEVYQSFVAGDVTKSSADFGVGADGYIFITEKSGLAADQVVTIRPYIKDTANKYYHDEAFVLKLKI